ncbi:MAG: CDP-glycerol glycerophosphotransferase family protein [Clostridia bacterium]|nr:CDP-glycerol glycerophosphotransferase family protein [Clostridia bacterium]
MSKVKELVKKSLGYVQRRIASRNVTKFQKRTRKRVQRKEALSIVFLIQFPEMWNSYKTIYEHFSALGNEVSLYILAVPKRVSVENGYGTFCERNEAFDFFKKNGISAIDAYGNGSWFPIKNLTPDYIFVQRPYEAHMPKEYSLYRLSKAGTVCYVPYGGRMTKGIHLSLEFNHALLNNAYMIFADCTDSYNYILNNPGVKKRKVFDIGYPRFDLIESPDRKIEKPVQTFLWTPRWAYDQVTGYGHFLDYFECLMLYFETHKDFRLIIRPHPLMFPNFIQKGLLSNEEYQGIQKRVTEAINVSFDENADYLITFKESDALISDGSSLLLEYFVTGKPILCCMSCFEDPTEITQRLQECFYTISNADQLMEAIVHITENDDYRVEQRIALIKKIKHGSFQIGRAIVKEILEDATAEKIMEAYDYERSKGD